MLNGTCSIKKPTKLDKQKAFEQIKNNWFQNTTQESNKSNANEQKDSVHSGSTADSTEKNNSINLQSTTSNVENSNKLTQESIINIIKYIFADQSADEDSAFIDQNILENINQLKENIDTLKQNIGIKKVTYTRSAVDLAMILYLTYVINDPNTRNNTNGYNGLDNIMNNSLSTYFKEFLEKECKINPSIIKKIPNRYIYAKRINGTLYIKLNNYMLDTNIVTTNNAIDRTKFDSHLIVKNKFIRENLSIKEIKELKEEAKKYYDNINTKIKNISQQEKQTLLKLNLTAFIKLANKSQRNLSKENNTIVDYIKLATDLKIFDLLDIKNNQKKIEFIQHTLMLNYHSNKGMILKRIFIKIPFGLINIGLLFGGLFLGIKEAMLVISKETGLTEYILSFIMSFEETNVLRYGLTGLKSFLAGINSGDHLNSYTNSTKIFFQELLGENFKNTQIWKTIKTQHNKPLKEILESVNNEFQLYNKHILQITEDDDKNWHDCKSYGSLVNQ
jgi:hypothetical protein